MKKIYSILAALAITAAARMLYIFFIVVMSLLNYFEDVVTL